ncbi:hypothetical protein EDD85DRAFT_798162 [Armillaria nabsnona]|nr:hypothetical protein EDD85DRAFT_798162 [Armillaria nabsnona]
MSFDDLWRLWSEIMPLFSVGAALTVPALHWVRILKEVAPIAQLRFPKTTMLPAGDQLSVNPHEANEDLCGVPCHRHQDSQLTNHCAHPVQAVHQPPRQHTGRREHPLQAPIQDLSIKSQ